MKCAGPAGSPSDRVRAAAPRSDLGAPIGGFLIPCGLRVHCAASRRASQRPPMRWVASQLGALVSDSRERVSRCDRQTPFPGRSDRQSEVSHLRLPGPARQLL